MASRQQQNDLWDAVEVIHHYYEDLFRPVASAFSLTTGQLRVLHTLRRFGSLPIGELAAAVGMARTNMSSLCKKLCKQGFLLRHRGMDGDERQVYLELTPEGESAARQAEAQLDHAEAVLREDNLEGLTQELSALARQLVCEPPKKQKNQKYLPAAMRMIGRAKSALLGEISKKELQHGNDS